jgi:hypothetical protein
MLCRYPESQSHLCLEFCFYCKAGCRYTECRYAQYRCTECSYQVSIPNVVLLSGIIPNVVMISGIILNVFMLNVVAPRKKHPLPLVSHQRPVLFNFLWS